MIVFTHRSSTGNKGNMRHVICRADVPKAPQQHKQHGAYSLAERLDVHRSNIFVLFFWSPSAVMNFMANERPWQLHSSHSLM
jgi:hypothetical protein